MLRERRRHAHYKLNSRLDRKSSRGMIYENEELRLRTININAEVEKGQSDIKRLRRENEQLRREIWTLRDECDRLNKRFKAKLAEYEKSDCSARESGGSSVSFLCDGLRYGDAHCGCNSEQYECETCQAIDEQCQNCVYENSQQSMEKRKMSNNASFLNNTTKTNGPKVADKYDHLSVVSEETHSNLETTKKDPPPPRSPIEKFADEIVDAQANIPPLSYFENVVERESHIVTKTEYEKNQSHAWDHNIQSPFAIRKQRYENVCAGKSDNPIGWNVKNYATQVNGNGTAQAIEVVELKEKETRNSDLAKVPTTHPCSTFLSTKTLQNGNGTHAEPPDVCVTNGLASPYQAQQVKEDKSHNIFRDLKTSTDSEDVSDEYINCKIEDYYQCHIHEHQHLHHHHHHQQQQEQQQQQHVHFLNNKTHLINQLTAFNCDNLHYDNCAINSHYAKNQYEHKRIHVSAYLSLGSFLTDMHLPVLNKPIYATASNRCSIIMTASTIKRPLMMASTFESIPLNSQYRQISMPNLITTFLPAANKTKTKALFANTHKYQISAENLESLLNDIENISEDICALQLQHQQQQRKIDEHDNRIRSKSRNNLQQDHDTLSQQYKDNKKAFRSEMNLMLSFDGANTTFLPINTNKVYLDNHEHPRTSSLGRDYEQSPQPCMPDPMTLLPENYGYLAHHKLKLDSLHNSANRLPNSDQNLHTTPNDAFPLPNINNIAHISETPPTTYELANLVPNRSQLYANVQNNNNNNNNSKSNQIYNTHPFPIVSSDYIDSTSNDITPDSTKENSTKNDFLNTQKDTISTISPHTAASWSDIPTAVDRKYLKSFSYSTPNSPHTTRRHSTKQKTEISHELVNNKDGFVPVLKSSLQQPNVHNKPRKNSRRHSDCTHLNNINPVVKSINNNGHCHLHRHHHHLHRPSLIKNCNSYLRKDSHVETGTTASDRQSNSFPSRESSISFNGVARKLSISSNKGGKIPWCGCWGNGCL